jgi:exocyst complex component 2
MALEIVQLYISLLSQFFNLSDMAVMASPNASYSSNAPPTTFPQNSTSLSTAHYLLKILGEIQDCVNELNTMEISGDVSTSLKGLLDSTKWRFEDVLVSAWLRGKSVYLTFTYAYFSLDASNFHHLEAWIPSPSDPSATHYLTQMELFQRHVTTVAYRIASGVDSSSSSLISKGIKQNPIPAAFVAKLTKAFMDVLRTFLEGLVKLVEDEQMSLKPVVQVVATSTSTTPNASELLDLDDKVGTSSLFPSIACMPIRYQDTRLLLVLSNIGHLSRSIYPSMVTQLENAFGITVADERQVGIIPLIRLVF